MTREDDLRATIEILVDVFGTAEQYHMDAEFHAKVERAAHAKSLTYAELERADREWFRAVYRVRGWYPEDVFPWPSDTPEGKAAQMARHTCDNIIRELKRIRGEQSDGSIR